MKLNISYPATGCQKVLECDDDRKLRAFYDKRISHEVEGDVLGEQFEGYVFRISGGNDKEGFPMKQGVLSSERVRLLFSKGHSCFRPRRKGERKRKSVRGCVVSQDLAVLNLVIVKKGKNEVDGLTTEVRPRRRGPKRATRIRRLFSLDKKDDVRKYVVRRVIKPAIEQNGKIVKPAVTKAPKIQRLVTPERLQRKRREAKIKTDRYLKSQAEAKVYNEKLQVRLETLKQKRFADLQKRRAVRKATADA